MYCYKTANSIIERSLSPARSFTSETDRNLSQRHSPIGAETSDDDNDVVDDLKNVAALNGGSSDVDEKSLVNNDEWDSWGEVDTDATRNDTSEVFSPASSGLCENVGDVKTVDAKVEVTTRCQCYQHFLCH
jgi:hypothetical protein